MKLLTSGMMLVFLVFATGLAYAADAPPEQGENPPAQPPAEAQQMEMYKATEGQVTAMGPKAWKDVIDKIAPKMNEAFMAALQRFGIEPTVTINFGLAPLPPEQLAQTQSVPLPGADGKSIHYVMAVPQGQEAEYDIDDLIAVGQMYSILNIAFALQIQATQPDVAVSFPRWFINGMVGYCLSLAAQELLGDESYRLYNSLFGEKKLEFFNEKLLTWNWKEKLPTDQYFAMVCAEIFVQIEKQFGPEALVKIGKGLAAAPKADKDTLCKAISDAIGQDFAAWLKNFKCTAKYPVMGFNSDGDYTGPGAKAKSITPDSAAAEAGFQEGDIITKVNGTEIKDNPQFGRVLVALGPGGKVVATVKRGDTEIELTATLKERTTFTFDVNEFPTAPPPQPQDQGPVG